jgi:hypothetical protein
LSHSTSPFLVMGFLRYGLVNYFPWLALNHDPPDLCSWVARITGVSHQRLASSTFCIGYFWDRVSHYAWGARTRNLQFVLPCIAGMTGTGHCPQPSVGMESFFFFLYCCAGCGAHCGTSDVLTMYQLWDGVLQIFLFDLVWDWPPTMILPLLLWKE